MNLTEHLLTILGEEGSEITKECSKANRFGLTECSPKHPKSNGQRISDEITDLLAVAEMLHERGLIPDYGSAEGKSAKKAKVLRYMGYSTQCGTLDIRVHQIYDDRDEPGVPDAIKDANGDIVLSMCRVCGQGEAELDIDCPGVRK